MTKQKYVKLQHVQELMNLIKKRDFYNCWTTPYATYQKKIDNTLEFIERNAKEVSELAE